MTFVGLDLHKRYITACALEATGGVVAEIRQLATTIATVLDRLAALPQPVVIAMEATLYWEWLVARLQEAGHTAHVADAYQVKLIWQARSKTDIIDARKLAERLRTNLLPAIWCQISRPVGAVSSFAAGRSSCANARASRIAFTATSPLRISSFRAAIYMGRPVARGSRRSHCRRCWRRRRGAYSICMMY
jgi:transposase